MSEVTYPGIKSACFLIALDNGGINWTRGEKQQNKEFMKWLARQDYPNLPEIDRWLAGLSEKDLDTVCVGEQSEMEALLTHAPVFTDQLLNAYFDEVC